MKQAVPLAWQGPESICRILLTRPRNRDNEFAVFLGDGVCSFTGRAAVSVFFSIAITSCLTGLSERQTLPPVGDSIGVRSTSSILEIFSPASADCIIL